MLVVWFPPKILGTLLQKNPPPVEKYNNGQLVKSPCQPEVPPPPTPLEADHKCIRLDLFGGRLMKWSFFVFHHRRRRMSLDLVFLVSRGQQTQLHITTY